MSSRYLRRMEEGTTGSEKCPCGSSKIDVCMYVCMYVCKWTSNYIIMTNYFSNIKHSQLICSFPSRRLVPYHAKLLSYIRIFRFNQLINIKELSSPPPSIFLSCIIKSYFSHFLFNEFTTEWHAGKSTQRSPNTLNWAPKVSHPT